MQAFPACLALTLVSLLPAATVAAASPPAQAHPYAAHVAEASRRFGIPALWIDTVLRAESAGDPRAVSRAGAIGLMQIMPDTWADLRARYRLGRDPYDPRDNILAGAAYLSELHDRYGSPAFLAAYNAGPGRYEASLAGRALPAETRAYVAAIAPKIGVSHVDASNVRASPQSSALLGAPLFVARSDRSSVATLVPPKEPPDAAKRNLFAVTLQPGDLFVARPAQRPAR